jgi:hypothetical protein
MEGGHTLVPIHKLYLKLYEDILTDWRAIEYKAAEPGLVRTAIAAKSTLTTGGSLKRYRNKIWCRNIYLENMRFLSSIFDARQ